MGDPLDLLDPSHYRAGIPHERFAELRGIGPVHWHPRTPVPAFETDVEFWAVLGHPELVQVNRDWETFAATDGPTLTPFPPDLRDAMLVSKDPPDHHRMRKLISAGFTPRMIGRLDQQIRDRTAAVLDAAAERGELDFAADVAYLLPMHVIGDILGIPESDRGEVFAITEVMLRAMDPAQGVPRAERERAEIDLYTYAHELTQAKKAEPTDDVWSILANGELGEFELDLFFLTLTIAGSETTQNGLTQGLLALVEHPDQLAELRADPDLLPSATEEILRWSSPVICFGRTATRDVELGGQLLRAGDRVGLFHPSANRDERVFDEPQRFDIHRSPNPHVAFGGGGPHFCLGASLARSELRVLLGELVRRFTTIELTGDPVWLSAGPAVNVGVGIRSLPVRLR